MEELIAAETNKGSEGHQNVGFFVIILDNIYFLVQQSLFPKENYSTLTVLEFLVNFGYTLSKPEHEGFKDRTPRRKSSTVQRSHMSLSRNGTFSLVFSSV